ncbi:signal peptidase I [Enterococcus sp. LJL99]
MTSWQKKFVLKKSNSIYLIGSICLFIAFYSLFFFGFERHQVSGDSMAPTLNTNDLILVKKHAKLKRYDLITFDSEIPTELNYVKRLIGLPGDQIWVKDEAVYLRPKEAGKWNPKGREVVETNQLPDSTLKVTVSESVARNLKGFETIPNHCYFVLGDNRKASKDSRSIGFIKEEQIEGVVLFRYYPFL